MKKFNWNGKFGPLLIAEIGGNHEGDFAYAKKLVRKAISTDVDVIKLQIYKGKTLVSKIESLKRYKHFEKFELEKKEHIYLADMCKEAKKIYLASVWDEDTIKWLNPYLKFYKIGSGDLTAYPIIKKITDKRKPILLSTGLSNLSEVKNTIKFIRSQSKYYNSKNNLAILQCTSSYPTSDDEVNLNVIKTYKKIFKYPIGYSNHNPGDLCLITAYILGAQILEFHFTDDRKGKVFRDHKLSLNPNETEELIEKLKKIKKYFGTSDKKPTASEIKSKNIKSFRRSLYLNKDLTKGYKIKEKDIICLRPNHSVDPRRYSNLIGKKLKKNVSAYKKFIL